MNAQLIAVGFLGALAGLAVALPLGGIAAPITPATTPDPGPPRTGRSGPPAGALMTVSPAGVRVVKQALNRLGYPAGRVSGGWDAALSRALAEFQRAHGLDPTGTMTVSAVTALGLWNRIIGDPLGNGRKPLETLQDLYGPTSATEASSAAGALPSQRITNEVAGGGAAAAGANPSSPSGTPAGASRP